VPEAERIAFRIGVNLGDVIVEGDDIFGDGVNVAARLEGLAEPGGVCISAKVHDEVRDRLELTFEDLGEQEVKNIARPVRSTGSSCRRPSSPRNPATARQPPACPTSHRSSSLRSRT
jgi:class 3 adenylate cyclase